MSGWLTAPGGVSTGSRPARIVSAAAGPKASAGIRQEPSAARRPRPGPLPLPPAPPGGAGPCRMSSGAAAGPRQRTAARESARPLPPCRPGHGGRRRGRPARRPARRGRPRTGAGLRRPGGPARRAGPARAGSSESSAHRQSAPRVQIPWMTSMPQSCLPPDQAEPCSDRRSHWGSRAPEHGAGNSLAGWRHAGRQPMATPSPGDRQPGPAPAAMSAEVTRRVPPEHLDLLAAEGFYGLAGPRRPAAWTCRSRWPARSSRSWPGPACPPRSCGCSTTGWCGRSPGLPPPCGRSCSGRCAGASGGRGGPGRPAARPAPAARPGDRRRLPARRVLPRGHRPGAR